MPAPPLTPEEAALLAEVQRSASPPGTVPPPPRAPAPAVVSPAGTRTFRAALRGEREKERDLQVALGATGVAAAEAAAEHGAELEAQRVATPVSFGGHRVPTLMGTAAIAGRRLSGAVDQGAGFLADLGSALLPQSAETEGQQAQRATLEQLATQASRAPAIWPQAVALQDAAEAALLSPEEYERRRAQIDSAAAVEGPAGYALRLLGAPGSIVAGAVEAAASPKSATETIPDRIRGGAGLTGLGAEAGASVGRGLDRVAEQVAGLDTYGALEAAGGVQGGLLGLVGDVGLSGGLSAAWRKVVGEAAPAVRTAAQIQGEAAAKIRDFVNHGIPQTHFLTANRLIRELGLPPADASAVDLVHGIAGEAGTGTDLVRGIASALGGTLDDVTEAALAARAEALTTVAPAAGYSDAALALVREVAESAGVTLAPDDARRALAAAFNDAKTFEVVRRVVGQLPEFEQGPAAVALESAIGPKEYLEALGAQPGGKSMVEAVKKASGIVENSQAAELAKRAETVRRLAALNASMEGGPAPVRRAWSVLQSALGYGTPIVDEWGRPSWLGTLDRGTTGAIPAVLGAVGRQAERTMRSGMLAGNALINPRFHITNGMTAPAIVYSTLGPRAAYNATFSLDGYRVLDALRGGPGAQVVAVAPDGTEYTARTIADLIASRGVNKSQAGSDLGRDVMEDIAGWAQRRSDGRFLSHLKSLFGYGDNIWAGIADSTDTFFRTNVLTGALRDGATPDQAVTMARQALFDYGNLSEFERRFLGNLVWFWSFRRNNYLTLWNNIRRNPSRLMALASANNAWSGATPEGEDTTFLATNDYAENLPMWRMMSDPETAQRYALTGPPIPQVQALEDLIGGLNTAVLMAEDVSRDRRGHGARAAFERGRDALLPNLNPPTQAAVAQVFGVDLRNGAQGGLSHTIPPGLTWWLQQTPGMWESAIPFLDLQEVDRGDVKAGATTTPGQLGAEGTGQWRIGSSDGAANLALLQAGLTAVGQQRAMEGYAPALEWARELATGEPPAVTAPRLGTDPALSAWDRMLLAAGVLSAAPMPRFEDTPERNAKIREREVIDADRR